MCPSGPSAVRGCLYRGVFGLRPIFYREDIARLLAQAETRYDNMLCMTTFKMNHLAMKLQSDRLKEVAHLLRWGVCPDLSRQSGVG
jgi:hypothetical protein